MNGRAAIALVLCLGLAALPVASAEIPAPGCSEQRWTQPDLGLQRELWGQQAIDATYCHDEAPPLGTVDGWGGSPWFSEECMESSECMRFYLFGWSAIYQLTLRDAGARGGLYHAFDPGTMPNALGMDACADLASGPNATCDDGEIAHARASAYLPRFETFVYLVPFKQSVGAELVVRPFDHRDDGDITDQDVGIEGAPTPAFVPDRVNVTLAGQPQVALRGDPGAEDACALPRVWTSTMLDTPCFRREALGPAAGLLP